MNKYPMKSLVTAFFVFISIAYSSSVAYGHGPVEENDTVRKHAIRVFLDCRNCDLNYIREEIPYINYVRDVKEAQVYILVTTMVSGSGGTQQKYTFQGQNEFRGMNDTLSYTSSPDQTRTQIRDKTTNLMKMGLMRYVARTPLSNEINIRHNGGLRAQNVIDKWNNWVIELSTNPRFNADQTYRSLNLRNSVEVTRITEDLKFEFRINHSLNQQRFIREGADLIAKRGAESINSLLVKSLNDHWSAGLRFGVGASTLENYNLNTEFMPAIEYDLFPYADASHRQLRFQYSIGPQFSKYNDSTFYYKMRETLLKESVQVAYQIQQKWGNINLSLSGSHYFHDFSKNSIGLDGFVNIRVFKGMSLSFNGGVNYINDQINLAKGNLSEAEILLRLKAQASKYSLNGGFGLTYVFGSIYNNVVNPRFGRMSRFNFN
jgi:hypothetical protein